MIMNFFDAVYCTHLPAQRERKRLMEIEFKKVGLNKVEFIHAPVPPFNFVSNLYNRNASGEFGCSLSGCKAIIHGISRNAKNVLVFDDDVYFVDDALAILDKGLKQLRGKDWSVLYLGGNLLIRTRLLSPNLLRTGDRFDGSYTYCINGKYLLDFVDYWMYGITHGLYKGKKGNWSPYDVILSYFAKKTNAGYCIYPPIVKPLAGMSTVDKLDHPIEKLTARIENNWARNLIK